jgi:hypothetical protein
LLFVVLLASCTPEPQPVSFPVLGSNQILQGLSRQAVEGRLDISRPKTLEYLFESSPFVQPPASIEIGYTLNVPAGASLPRIVVDTGANAWVLPGIADSVFANGNPADGAVTGGTIANGVFYYAIPIGDPVPQRFSIYIDGSFDRRIGSGAAMQIRSIAFRDRWFGFYRLDDPFGDNLYLSPFVSRRAVDSAWVIDMDALSSVAVGGVPAGLFPAVAVDISMGGGAVLDIGRRRFTASSRLGLLSIPPLLVASDSGPLVLSQANAVSFRVRYAQTPAFPEPITADPGMALAWPEDRWRDSRYEVFRWESFPSLLIFDFFDYDVQDRMLKRLAFFVEKAGFRGRLARDGEIADLHGWNAHDYRAVDLARFFQAARNVNFPLLAEERELERMLVSAGIIRESDNGLQAGEGGIISVSRESDENLRQRFMAHEGFHGLFFIDDDFRDFSRGRWEQLAAVPKRFILSYFGFQQYDVNDEYLVINEFMAHVLQQPVAQAGHYFGTLYPSRLEDSERRRWDLPEKDQATNSWPVLASAFTREARAFSEYVDRRWGLAAGSVSLVTVRQP